jgi:NADP-dependent 3-hydroxy acid dehydrogenase YdfG
MEGIKDKVVFAIEQPADVDVGEIIVRPTAQSYSEVRAARALN